MKEISGGFVLLLLGRLNVTASTSSTPACVEVQGHSKATFCLIVLTTIGKPDHCADAFVKRPKSDGLLLEIVDACLEVEGFEVDWICFLNWRPCGRD